MDADRAEIQRVPSRLHSLDQMIGGFPSNSVVAFIGKKAYLEQVGIHISKGDTLFISTNKDMDRIHRLAQSQDALPCEMTVLDAYSWRIQRVSGGSYKSSAAFTVSNLNDLNALLAKIIQALKAKPEINRIHFDSLSSLLIYSIPGEEQVYKFFELLSAYTHANDLLFTFTLEKDMHPPTMVDTLKFMSDGVIQFKRSSTLEMCVEFLWLSDYDPVWGEVDLSVKD